jgi:hypothetical protein
MRNQKKMAAAVAAVVNYIQFHEELGMIGASEEDFSAKGVPQVPVSQMSVWRFAGRQDQMQLGMQMQLKAFHRFKTHQG